MMKGFILSLQSEFYKSRKTLGFWAAVILPLLICLLVFIGFLTHSERPAQLPGMMLWMTYAGAISNVMGVLLLPMFIIFIAYSVNSIEHKADTWKTLFTLPISKWAVYSAKYFYALLLVFLCLLLFYLFTLGSGNLLGILKPELKFRDYDFVVFLGETYLKLFMVSLGILSIQFLLSLLWSDFLKPMGIGFIGTITGIILVANKYDYDYLLPYAHPLMALGSLIKQHKIVKPGPMPVLEVDLFTKEVFVSLAFGVVIYFIGFVIVQRKSVK